MRWTVIDTDHKVPFVSSISDSYTQAFNLLVAAFQRQVFTLNLPLVVDTSTSPFSPLSSEQP